MDWFECKIQVHVGIRKSGDESMRDFFGYLN
jgi:hypothetical protein